MKENYERVRDYRPISGCNAIYKCIEKNFVNRMKVVTPNLISKSQAKGRRISDKILLAYELVHNYHRAGMS